MRFDPAIRTLLTRRPTTTQLIAMLEDVETLLSIAYTNRLSGDSVDASRALLPLSLAANVLVPMHKAEATVLASMTEVHRTMTHNNVWRLLNKVASILSGVEKLQISLFKTACRQDSGLVPINVATSYNKPVAFWYPTYHNHATAVGLRSPLKIRDTHAFARTLAYKYQSGINPNDLREIIAGTAPIIVHDLCKVSEISEKFGDKVGVKKGRRKVTYKSGKVITKFKELVVQPVNMTATRRFVAMTDKCVLSHNVFVHNQQLGATEAQHKYFTGEGYQLYSMVIDELNSNVDMRRDYLSLNNDMEMVTTLYLSLHAALVRIKIGINNLLRAATAHLCETMLKDKVVYTQYWQMTYSRPNFVNVTDYEARQALFNEYGSMCSVLPHEGLWGLTLAPVPYADLKLADKAKNIERMFRHGAFFGMFLDVDCALLDVVSYLKDYVKHW